MKIYNSYKSDASSEPAKKGAGGVNGVAAAVLIAMFAAAIAFGLAAFRQMGSGSEGAALACTGAGVALIVAADELIHSKFFGCEKCDEEDVWDDIFGDIF